MDVDSSMNANYIAMAEEIRALLEESGKEQLLVGIAGPCGVGKSTTASRLHSLLPESMVVSMDGYHYTKERLRQFPDVEKAFACRGAHWTFDADRFFQDLSNLKNQKKGSFPSFDHAVGDPIEGDIVVNESHRIVLVEGNYLCLDLLPWSKLTTDVFDFTYFLSADISVIEERVYSRHMSLGYGDEYSRNRVNTNDSPNAVLILKDSHRANKIVQSV